jgi:hypothetical protein
VSRFAFAVHPARVAVRSFVVVLAAALSASACVDEVHLLGDDRARLACEEASVLFLPPSGCTALTVESNSPYGCAERAGRGPSVEHTGSWVRVSGGVTSPAMLHVRLVSSGARCSGDGGPTSCPATVYVRDSGEPCTCEQGTFASYAVTATSTLDLSLHAPDQDVLLEPLGAVFELSLCADGAIGP